MKSNNNQDNNPEESKQSSNDAMYKEQFLEIYKDPDNFGKLEKFSCEVCKLNTSCGDEVKIQLLIKDNNVKDVKFRGKGCVISTVATSFLTEKIKGLDLDTIKNLSNKDIIDLLGIPISYARLKCALLSLEALKEINIEKNKK
jgi:nitrogen fixation NifU-like protein